MSAQPNPPSSLAAYRIAAEDDVAVALRDIEPGERVGSDPEVLAIERVPKGHKIALRAIASGQMVRKYGWPIGRSLADVAPGAHVHTHNLATTLSGVEEYRYQQAALRCRAGARG